MIFFLNICDSPREVSWGELCFNGLDDGETDD